MGRSMTFLGGWLSNFFWGRQKEGEQGGFGGETQNEVFICKITIIKQDTNFILQTVGQTNF